MFDPAIVSRAKALAEKAHAGQLDKAGRPYIEHVARVADAVCWEPLAEAVAWLHDVLEDCPKFHEEFWTFPADVTRPVHMLTRIAGQSPEFYYGRIVSNRIARMVKMADIADNSDPSRLALLDSRTAARLRKKYATAREYFGQSVQNEALHERENTAR